MNPLYVLAVLALAVAVSEWLCRTTPLRHLGTALVVILVAAVLANLGVIPTYSAKVPVYAGIFGFVAPLSIFWLLLCVRLRDVLGAGSTMLGLFVVGALGTTVGVVVGMHVVDGEAAFGELYGAFGGMFVGTYTGGSVNFNAIAIEYGVVEEGVLFAGAAAVDSLMTTVWMAVNLIVPRALGRYWPGAKRRAAAAAADGALVRAEELDGGIADDTETVHPLDLAWLLALGCGAVVLSDVAAAWLEESVGVALPSILILTTLALVLAQLPIVARLKGARLLGMFAVLLFLAVIGALCNVNALIKIGSLGTTIFLFVCVVVTVHGLFVYGAAALARLDPVAASCASQANVGGGTTALALARSLGRPDLVLPSILIGALGTAAGTYLGVLTAEVLLG